MKNRNSRDTRNREQAKSMMIHIMEHEAIVTSHGKLFTDRGRRWFITKASKKTVLHCDASLFLETKLKKRKEKKARMTHIKILTVVISG